MNILADIRDFFFPRTCVCCGKKTSFIAGRRLVCLMYGFVAENRNTEHARERDGTAFLGNISDRARHSIVLLCQGWSCV